MSDRIVLKCKGLYLKEESEAYRKITSLEFVPKKEQKTSSAELNPIVIEDTIPKSFPGEAIKIFERGLPSDLLEISDCVKSETREDSEIFMYKGSSYIIHEGVLCKIIQEGDYGV